MIYLACCGSLPKELRAEPLPKWWLFTSKMITTDSCGLRGFITVWFLPLSPNTPPLNDSRGNNMPYHCPYTTCTAPNSRCKCTESEMLGGVRAIPEFLADQGLVFAALQELGIRIERCGASLQLTHASSLCSDLRSAVGNKHNPPDNYAARRVRIALGGGVS